MIDINNLYNDLPNTKLILANPQKQYIDTITCAKEVKGKLNFSTLSEVSFKIYEYSDGIRNEMFDLIEEMRLVELVGVAWFQIQSASETQDKDNSTVYKQVKCLTLENELIGKQIDNIIGVYALYDVTDIEYSLLHIVERYCNWSIGHVSNELKSKWRTFNIDSEKIYNLLTGKVAESFGCVFQFDTYTKTINVYTLEELGEVTDITISNRNILQSYERTADKDNIITKMRVRGGTNSDGTVFDIRTVNPDGTTELINIDYYKVPFDPVTKQGWMTQGLVDAINNYQSAYNTYTTQYTNTLNTLKQHQSDLTTLKAQLRDIEGQIEVQNIIIGTSVENHNGRPPISGETDYSTYQTAITTRNTLLSQKAAKQTEIRNKSTQISNTQGLLDDISFDLDKNNYFTQSQLNELDSFLTQGDDYVDDTFLSTDTTTPEEEIEMKLELRNNAQKELERVSRPQYNIKTTISNLYTIQDDKDTKAPLSEWTNDLQLGNMITLILREDFYVTVRLLSIDFDLDNLSDIELTFSNRNRLDDSLIQLGEVIAQTNRTSKSFSLSQFGYDQASKITSPVREFINGTLNATKNAFTTNDNQDILIDQWGLHGRKWLSNQNKFDDRQLWLNNNGMLLSSDGFKSAQTAIGLLTAPDGATYYGVATEVLIGEIVISSKLRITNSSGNYTIDTNGFTASATVGSNDYSVGINPSTPADIINVKVNGVKKLYVDTTNSKLVFSGTLVGVDGEFSGTLRGNTIIGSTITGSNINGGQILSTAWDGQTYGTNYYEILLKDGTLRCSRTLYTSSGSTVDWATTLTYDTFTTVNINTTNLYSNNIGSSSRPVDRIDVNKIYSPNNKFQLNTLDTVPSLYFDGVVIRNSGIECNKINGYTPINSNNISSQSVAYASVAGTVSGLTTNQITASNTGYGNIDFLGFDNAAGVNWVQANYVPIGASDIRLKHDFKSFDDTFEDIFYSLKPYQFRYKTSTYGDGVFFGLIAQELESAFQSHGLNPYDYDLIEVKDVREYTDDGFYVNEKTHRVHYVNMISWLVYIVQKQNSRIKILENMINAT